MSKTKLVLLFGILSGIFFVGVGQPMLLIFSLFLITYSFREVLQKWSTNFAISSTKKWILVLFLVGILTELLAIWNTGNVPPSQIIATNQLFSADPLKDIVLGFGYYIPLGIIWAYLFRKYAYRVSEVFIIMGIFGVLFEGNGLVFLSFNLVMWLYAFVVHGSYLGIASIILSTDSERIHQTSHSKIEKYVFGFLGTLLIVIPYALWMSVIHFAW